MTPRSNRFKQFASSGLLVITAFIWGMCFVAQRSGMEYIGPFLFNGIRELLGSFTLFILVLVFLKMPRLRSGLKKLGINPELGNLKEVLAAGVVCGTVLYLASNLQQVGMVYVPASKAAFITTLYIVLVPLFGLFLKQRTHWNTWVSVLIAVIGLYLLCVGDSLILEFGDIILLLSAVFWALHILAVGHYSPQFSLMRIFVLCIVQFGVAGILSLISAPFADHYFVAAAVTWENISYVLPEILYAGILSTAVAFTLAAIGQRYAKPAPAAVIMSLESAFGLLGGVLILGEVLNTGEWIGCLLMFIAVILTQLEIKLPKRKVSTE